MSLTDKLKKQLTEHEGLRLKPYRCTAGKLTIGVGRNIDDKGITESEAMVMLGNDIAECLDDLRVIFPKNDGFDGLPENAKLVLADMRFNLGSSGFRKFRRLIQAVKDEDYNAAAAAMKNSRWYGQVGRRSKKLMSLMLK